MKEKHHWRFPLHANHLHLYLILCIDVDCKVIGKKIFLLSQNPVRLTEKCNRQETFLNIVRSNKYLGRYARYSQKKAIQFTCKSNCSCCTILTNIEIGGQILAKLPRRNFMNIVRRLSRCYTQTDGRTNWYGGAKRRTFTTFLPIAQKARCLKSEKV
jgi:hypothetical protein